MAARIHKIRHDEETRAKIKAAQLINRLHKHVMAPQPLMDASQVSAAKTLLSKVLPDLATTQLTGDPDNPLQGRLVVERQIVKGSDPDA